MIGIVAKKQTKKTAKAPRQRAEDLSARRAAFLREYLISRNATQAAVKAGYSENTARQQGQRLLTNVDIREAIRQEDERALAAARVTREGIIGELARVGFFDLRKAAQWGKGGIELKESDELDADTSAAIQSVESKPVEFGTQLKIKAHDKLGALKELAKIAGLYPDTKADKDATDEEAKASMIVVPADSESWRELIEPPEPEDEE